MELVWTGPAEADLYEISDFYREIDADVLVRMLQRIYSAPSALLDQPFLGSATRKSGVRKWPVKKTPFILLYAIRPRFIEIRRVVHVRSDWQTRDP